MKYAEFYRKANEQLIESLSNMWFRGHPDAFAHFKELISTREPLLSEPIFQTIFPWRNSEYNFLEHATKLGILDESFVRSIDSVSDEEHRFPLERHPYSHQTESWAKMLNPDESKTIVVTSGTGSGKTECFMIPVLQDLLRHHTEGIQAIFLYPLNALMNDQQKRIDEWCKSVNPQITYAIYNGDTPDSASRASKNKAYPQIICREDIRNNPPQILFTNPTLLNYMLVRKLDHPIIEKSRANKSLRWILLDEAHTYTGSAATELALQLRRVLNAFGVENLKEINFAITSATISSDDPQAKSDLVKMVATLTGKAEEDIIIIGGERIVPDLDNTKVIESLKKINTAFGLTLDADAIGSIRQLINTKPALSLSEICSALGYYNHDRVKQLELIDALGDKQDGLRKNGPADAMLPSRMHIFIRAINGIYTCSNVSCPTNTARSLDLGSMTTYQETTCPEAGCHAPMLEIVRCADCGGLLIIGEEGKDGYHMKINQKQDDVDLFDEVDEDDDNDISDKRLFVVGKTERKCPRNNVDTNYIYFNSNNGTINRSSTSGNGYFSECLTGERKVCPHCGKTLSFKDLKSFCVGAPFMGRTLSRQILEQAEKDSRNRDVVHSGQKFITFTDSRSGTAKSAMQSNLEVERNWIRSGIFHTLSEKRRINYSPCGLTEEELADFEFLKNLPTRSGKFQAMYEELLRKSEAGEPDTVALSWSEIFQKLDPDKNSSLLYEHLADVRKRNFKKWGKPYSTKSKEAYLNALMINQFGRMPKRENSLETLGLVHLVYPALSRVIDVPTYLANIFDIAEWRTYLKICVDYFIRENFHYVIPSGAGTYLVQEGFSDSIYGPNCTKDNVKKWPQLIKNKNGQVEEKQNRIISLLCACMGYDDVNKIDSLAEHAINEILKEAWRIISTRILNITDTTSDSHENYGYKLDLTDGDKVLFELMTTGWVCPVEHAIVDSTLKGLSPRLKGFLNTDNIERYRIYSPALHYAFFPYANSQRKTTAEGDMEFIELDVIQKWVDENWAEQKERGQYSDILQSIFENRKVFLTAEHSAQLSSDIRENSVLNFKKGILNILACSTTMEMGVDLSGISEVVMNTVPPKPANYLQRAGRAGRRNESKAMAITFCSATPVGNMAWENPTWPMTHPIKMPNIKLESHAIIQKHLNSAFFALYVESLEGINITTSVNEFFNSGTCDEFIVEIDNIRMRTSTSKTSRWHETYKRITVDTILENTTFDERLSACKYEMERVREIYSGQILMLNDSLKHIPSGTAAYNAVNKRLECYKAQKVLTFLSENGFLPSAGMPIGLVEFITGHPQKENKNDEYRHESFPSKHISQAIAEYAPGNQIVINEWCYESAGIGLKNTFADTDRYIIQQCNKCKYTSVHRGTPLKECPSCHSKDTMKGVWNSPFTEIIEPVSFTVDSNATTKRRLKTAYIGHTRPMLLRMHPWASKSKGAKCVIRSSNENSSTQVPEILFYNSGANGKGYAFCPYCGRVESEPDGDHNLMPNHKRLDCEQVCDGNGHVRNNVLLVGRYQTDFVEIKIYDKDDLEITDQEMLYSLGVVFCRKLSEILGINDGEIGFGLNKDFNSIFIYDTAIGGAGYSTLFRDYKNLVFDESLNFLNNCSCTRSCTKCLIDRQTQWSIDLLNRKKAIDWLRLERESRTASAFALSHFPMSQSLTCDLSGEISHLINAGTVNEIYLFVDDNISNWDIARFKYHNILKTVRRKKISYILSKSIDFNTLDSANLANCVDVLMDSIEFLQGEIKQNVVPLMMVTLTDGSKTLYFGENNPNAMNGSWGEGKVYYTEYVGNFEPKVISKLDLIQKLHGNSVVMHFSITDAHVRSSGFLNLLISSSGEDNKWSRIGNQMRGKSVDIEFNDKHLNSPMACFILCNLIKQCQNSFNLRINSITLNLEKLTDFDNYRDHILEHHFQNHKDQESIIYDYFNTILGITPIIKRDPIYQHERDLIFTSNGSRLVILPNGGINWGWHIDRTAHENYRLQDSEDLNDDNVVAVLNNYKGKITYTITLK